MQRPVHDFLGLCVVWPHVGVAIAQFSQVGPVRTLYGPVDNISHRCADAVFVLSTLCPNWGDTKFQVAFILKYLTLFEWEFHHSYHYLLDVRYKNFNTLQVHVTHPLLRSLSSLKQIKTITILLILSFKSFRIVDSCLSCMCNNLKHFHFSFSSTKNSCIALLYYWSSRDKLW